jgi:peptidyl-prolyl cis-trans isomerase A (cyclophilin A)
VSCKVRVVAAVFAAVAVCNGAFAQAPAPHTPATGGALVAKPALPAARATATPGQYRSIYQLNDDAATGPLTLDGGTYAVFHTSDGDFIASLFTSEAPNTTRNFTDLAQGRKSWKHPVTLAESNRPLYNNTTIYRIIPDTIIFGGDPINKGQGDSGALLPLENTSRQFNEGGLLAMDGNGTEASGSRWFVTLRPFPDRNGHYTIIGKIAGGLDVVSLISNKPTKKPQVPLDATLLSSIEVVEVPQGMKTTATFSTEDGKRVLSIDRNFTRTEEPKATVAAGDVATSGAAVTTGTAAAVVSTGTAVLSK